jgi:magnesium-transporting ATPase (P-type)
VLVAAGALAISLGRPIDGAVVLGVVVANALIGFVQEFRAGKAIEALVEMVPDTATVVRDRVRTAVPATELVPGDIVLLASGDKVPADLRLLAVRGLMVEEAALTGESVPVAKIAEAVAEASALADRTSMAYAGTLVTAGTGEAVVSATGAATELGRISALLEGASQLETPLTRAMTRVATWLTIAISSVAALLFAIGLARGYPLVDAVLAAITLAVGAIPEGLPAIITIALAIGVQRMARRRAVIRRLSAVETLGSTTVICTDKTGTLTRNEMTVKALWTPADGDLGVSGVGYAPEGVLEREGRALAEPTETAVALLRAAVLCSDATVTPAEGGWRVAGDPTEGALVVAARKAGLDPESERGRHPRRDAVPFESEHRFMATLHAGELLLKGAPEIVLERCRGVDADAVAAEVDDLAAQGMRVLAVARSAHAGATIEPGDLAGNFSLLGLIGMIDPPRPEALEAVRVCHAAGITVKMITGDHPATAEAIARELGRLDRGGSALTGVELAGMGDADLASAAARTNVFARVAPEHKLRLVRALQAQGQVVAMTGDGVNDAPALKQADIGVAMGITGTAVSKESADIVLADDNFASIAAAVEEGRRVYDNLVKALAFVLPTNVGFALVIPLRARLPDRERRPAAAHGAGPAALDQPRRHRRARAAARLRGERARPDAAPAAAPGRAHPQPLPARADSARRRADDRRSGRSLPLGVLRRDRPRRRAGDGARRGADDGRDDGDPLPDLLPAQLPLAPRLRPRDRTLDEPDRLPRHRDAPCAPVRLRLPPIHAGPVRQRRPRRRRMDGGACRLARRPARDHDREAPSPAAAAGSVKVRMQITKQTGARGVSPSHDDEELFSERGDKWRPRRRRSHLEELLDFG